MKNSSKTDNTSSLKLAVVTTLVILLGFAALMSGIYVYREYSKRKKEPKDVGSITIHETFSDGVLDKRFATGQNGQCKWNVKSGVLTMDQDRKVEDAGLIYLVNSPDVTRPMIFKNRLRAYNLGPRRGSAIFSWSFIQRSDPPSISSFAGQFRISVLQHDKGPWAGDIRISYYDSRDTEWSWNEGSGKWRHGCFQEPLAGPAGGYFTTEFHSDGTKWYIILRDSGGNTIARTDPVAWANTRDNSSPYWICFGSEKPEAHFGDMDVDYIYVSYTPRPKTKSDQKKERTKKW